MGTKAVEPGITGPQAGEKFRCEGCGMEIEVTKNCHCEEGEHVRFECCGKQMSKV